MKVLPITAVYDANVLYPAPLRDLLVRLGIERLVLAKWTDLIHDEWIRNVLKSASNATLARLARTRLLMNQAVPDCLVVGYEFLIQSLVLPDPDDRHVLAAAIHAKANLIVTFNLKDFPQSALTQFAVRAIHPDEFLVYLLGLAPNVVCAVVRKQRTALQNPPTTVQEMLDTLDNQGLPRAVAILRQFAAIL